MQKFNKNIEEVSQKTITEVLDKLNINLGSHIFGVKENGDIDNNCKSCKKGTLGIKVGKFGVFIGCSNYPECKNTQQLSKSKQGDETQDLENQLNEPKIIGQHSVSKNNILIKKGPYGFYIELEEKKDDSKDDSADKKTDKKTGKKPKKPKKTKPKRVSIPKNIPVAEVTQDVAEKLLSLPRDIGKHPETNLSIKASIGPFGPYLLHDGKYSSVKKDDVLNIELDRALIVIKEDLEKKSQKKNKKRIS